MYFVTTQVGFLYAYLKTFILQWFRYLFGVDSPLCHNSGSEKQITAPSNNTRTLTFKVQPRNDRNAFLISLPSIKCFRGCTYLPTTTERAGYKSNR